MIEWTEQVLNLADLKPFEKNPRKISKDQFERLKTSLKENGYHQRILATKDNRVIGGHQRLKALKELGIEKVKVLKPDADLSDQQFKRLVIQDNLHFGEFDIDILAGEFDLGDLKEIGMPDDILAALDKKVSVTGLVDEDEAPPAPVAPKTKRGDVWLCGDHRIMCGDSTSKKDMLNLMSGKKAYLVFTSPPYNANAVAPDGDVFTSKKSQKLYSDGYHDNRSSDDYIAFASSVLELCFEFTKGFIFWNVSYNANSRFEYIAQIQSRLEYLIEQICWKKTSTIPFKGSFMREWEPIFVFSTDKKTLGLEVVVGNHWEISNTNSQQKNHKACFPVQLPEKAIDILNKMNGIVLEPFGGSGSTLIACEKTGRINHSMELDEKYCDVIVQRWQNFTGKDAILESTGKTFNETANG